jgi:uncharacterized protein (DUF1684 family)
MPNAGTIRNALQKALLFAISAPAVPAALAAPQAMRIEDAPATPWTAPSTTAIRVVDELGRPLANARVTIVEPLSRSARLDRSPEAELLRRGTSCFTGDDGLVSFAIDRFDLRLVARSADGARYGLAAVQPRGGLPLEVVTRPETTLPIVVLDAAGQPADGAELLLESSADFEFGARGGWVPDGLESPQFVAVLLADEHGHSRLTAADRFALAALAGLENAAWSDASWRIVAAGTNETAASVTATDGAESLLLVLPRLARVEFELRDLGGELAAIDATGGVELQVAPVFETLGAHSIDRSVRALPAPRRIQVRFRSGRCVLDQVEVGLSFSLRVEAGRRQWSSEGEVQVAAESDRMKVAVAESLPPRQRSFRLLDEAGAPLAQRPVEARLLCGESRLGSCEGASFDDGRIGIDETALHRALGDDLPLLQELEFLVEETPESAWVGRIEASRTECGPRAHEIVLTRRSRPVVLAGHVVDERGRPLTGVALTASVAGVGPLERGRIRRTGPDGAFAFHGEAPEGASAELALGEFEFGTRQNIRLESVRLDARVELVRCGVVAGSLRLDPGMEPDDFFVRIGQQEARASPSGGSARFELLAVPAGVADLVVLHQGPLGSHALATLSDVIVPSAWRADDTRLASIDVRGRLRATALRISDLDGRPIDRGTIGFDEAAHRAAEEPSCSVGFERGECRLVTPDWPPPLTVRAPGFRTREFDVRATTETIELAPALPFRVQFAMSQLPAGGEWRFEVEGVHLEERETVELAVASGGVPQSGVAPRGARRLRGLRGSSVVVRPDGEIALHASAPGPIELVCHVMRRDPETLDWECLRCLWRELTLENRRDAPPLVLALTDEELADLHSALRPDPQDEASASADADGGDD